MYVNLFDVYQQKLYIVIKVTSGVFAYTKSDISLVLFSPVLRGDIWVKEKVAL